MMEDENLILKEYEDEDGKHVKRFFPSGKLKDILHIGVSQSYRERVLEPAQKISKEIEERLQIDLLRANQQKMEGLQAILDISGIADKHKETTRAEIAKCKKWIDDIKKKLE